MVAQDLLPTEHQGTSLDKRLGLVLWSRREAVLLMTETLGGPLTRPVAQRKTPPRPHAPSFFVVAPRTLVFLPHPVMPTCEYFPLALGHLWEPPCTSCSMSS